MSEGHKRAAERKTLESEKRFRELVESQGGKCAYDIWAGAQKPNHIICQFGHDAWPKPSKVFFGDHGLCAKCGVIRRTNALKDKSERRFQSAITALGGVCLYTEWEGMRKTHLVRCINNHLCYVAPNSVLNIQGRGICHKCSDLRATNKAETEFKSRLNKRGATLISPWRGSNKPHKVICSEGHECSPYPTHIQYGWGICAQCARQWNIVYVVTSKDFVKLGITSNDPKPRLRDHKRAGYDNILLVAENIKDARGIERAILDTLSNAGYSPVKGREYFNLNALKVILKELENLGVICDAAN